jgi:DNA-binding PadR family transcriptional regulator
MRTPRRDEAPGAQSFLPLTPNFFEILLTLAQGEAHGYAIMRQVEERTRGAVRLLPGTMYRAFYRLEELGLIEEAEARPDPHLDDERRRYYRLTQLGREVAAAEAQRLAEAVRTARRSRLIPGQES